MKLPDALGNVRRLFLDTAPAIYFLERHPVYFPRMQVLFRIRRERMIVIVRSPVTLAECLVHPIRRGLAQQAEEYRRLILQGVGTEFHEIGPEAAEQAARVRAALSISLVDALQVGVALAAGCQAFVTNDRRLSKITEIPILLLDDLEV
jgi:predicted nucleic acid-binding protein